MQIDIEYSASWRNSFLDGDNNQPVPKKGRNFKSSISALNKDTYFKREISKNTVMGILNRLIGDQRKLYQSRSDENYYFSEYEKKITFNDNVKHTNEEIVYLRNISGNTDQNSFTGVIKSNDPIFSSNYSNEFWGILFLEIDELVDFILNGNLNLKDTADLNPITILDRLNDIKKDKAITNEGLFSNARDLLMKHFDKYNPLNKKEEINVLAMYCSGLYLQLQRLEDKYDISSAKTTRGGISGISNNGFTPKDFMAKYTSGEKKKVYGNPYILKEKIKGEREVVSKLKKIDGNLQIVLDISRKEAKELKQMIENAGVSSFYLGKKGLAYISNIDTREVS